MDDAYEYEPERPKRSLPGKLMILVGLVTPPSVLLYFLGSRPNSGTSGWAMMATGWAVPALFIVGYLLFHNLCRVVRWALIELGIKASWLDQEMGPWYYGPWWR